jgi:hypothetical protein
VSRKAAFICKRVLEKESSMNENEGQQKYIKMLSQSII